MAIFICKPCGYQGEVRCPHCTRVNILKDLFPRIRWEKKAGA